jgi:hypothetical protein
LRLREDNASERAVELSLGDMGRLGYGSRCSVLVSPLGELAVRPSSDFDLNRTGLVSGLRPESERVVSISNSLYGYALVALGALPAPLPQWLEGKANGGPAIHEKYRFLLLPCGELPIRVLRR